MPIVMVSEVRSLPSSQRCVCSRCQGLQLLLVNQSTPRRVASTAEVADQPKWQTLHETAVMSKLRANAVIQLLREARALALALELPHTSPHIRYPRPMPCLSLSTLAGKAAVPRTDEWREGHQCIAAVRLTAHFCREAF